MLRLDFPSGSELRSLKCQLCDKPAEVALRDTTVVGAEKKEVNKRLLLTCKHCLLEIKDALNKP